LKRFGFGTLTVSIFHLPTDLLSAEELVFDKLHLARLGFGNRDVHRFSKHCCRINGSITRWPFQKGLRTQAVHGRPENRGKGPERNIVYNEEGEIRVEYHMTEPAKISMGEKEKIVGWMEYMVDELRKEYQGSDILYVGLMPRHIERCCTEKSHMEGEDIVMLHGSRREFDRQMKTR
jgi:hypothetical protein